jgi:hypothetical protein
MAIERLSGGLSPANGSDPRTFPDIWNVTADEIEQVQIDVTGLLAKNIPDFGDDIPEDGQVLTFDEALGQWVPGRGSGASLTVDSVAPSDPGPGDLWFNSVLGRTFVYYEDDDSAQWVEIGAGSGPTAAAVFTSAPVSAELGQLWFDSETGNLYFYYVDADSAQWIQVRSAAPTGLVNVDVVNPAAGQKLVYDGTNWVNLEGYVYVDTLYFTSSGTFTKASYPWLRAIRVKVQGAGGGGGGAGATGASQFSNGFGGLGGAYAESFITDIAGLDASVTVTRGAGGAGGNDTPGAGSAGGQSSFGSIVTANGGGGGGGFAAGPDSNIAFFLVSWTGGGQANGSGDLVVRGRPSHAFVGGISVLGGPGSVQTLGNGSAGVGFGGGGSAGVNRDSSEPARSGGAGANGIVIVELFA